MFLLGLVGVTLGGFVFSRMSAKAATRPTPGQLAQTQQASDNGGGGGQFVPLVTSSGATTGGVQFTDMGGGGTSGGSDGTSTADPTVQTPLAQPFIDATRQSYTTPTYTAPPQPASPPAFVPIPYSQFGNPSPTYVGGGARVAV